MSNSNSSDVLIIGAGIAGASAAWALATAGVRVTMLEREAQPGYHSTGRSAAHWISSYGPPGVRASTLASRNFLLHPPAGFTDVALMRPRPVMEVAAPGQEALLEAAWQVARDTTPNGARLLSTARACACVPVLRPERTMGAVWQPDAFDIDVHALHQGFLRGARWHGAQVACDADVVGIDPPVRSSDRWSTGAHDLWCVSTRDGRSFDARVVINAAGAWCDVLARLAGVAPIGLEPRRRSAFLFAPPTGVDARDWPLTAAVDARWYFKPDAGLLLGSPTNADPTVPQDVQPEELDIAMGAHAIEEATTMTVKPLRRWAGLRSFTGDGEIVARFAEDASCFFWLAGQGGYGIQTAPAVGHDVARQVADRLRAA